MKMTPKQFEKSAADKKQHKAHPTMKEGGSKDKKLDKMAIAKMNKKK